FRMDPEPSLSKKKLKKPTGEYSITTLELEKPRGNKYSAYDWSKVRKKLGDCESDQEDERFHDKDAVAIAKQLEAKYGNKKTKSGRKIRFPEEDFIDKSLGYDCDDDWIDDSEAYDELVPSTVDTKRGGFYVNRGPLEFVSFDHELSDVQSDEDEGRPKKEKKKKKGEEATPPAAPVVNEAEDKKKEEKRAMVSSPLSSSDEEEEQREERRRVGGPPTLKKSKPSAAAAAAPEATAAAAPVVKKAEEEKTAEPRRMAGAPPTMQKKKSEPAVRPSLAGKPSSTAAAAPAARDIPVETVSSGDEIEVIEQPPSSQQAASLPKNLGWPDPVQTQVVQFQQFCDQQIKPGKKVPQVVVDKAIEIRELTRQLGMTKSAQGGVLIRMNKLCGYSATAGLVSRINATLASASASAARAAPATAAAAAVTSQPVSLKMSRVRVGGGGGGGS
ncbi:hypothetical protein PENTCL1PPCAC_29940, partial [Pristionchus entomophagus]